MARLEDSTDRQRLAAMTDDEIEARAAADPDALPTSMEFWADAQVHAPGKTKISLYLDDDILAWLKSGGRGYQTRINAMLRKVMQAATDRRFQILVSWDEADRCYLADVPDLPGVAARGDTEAEALSHARQAIASYLEKLLDAGEPPPPPRRYRLV